MNPTELFGTPVATWALIVSIFSFSIALVALGWQVVKHFLDGGRVRVYLNAAAWEPDYMLATNRSGYQLLNAENPGKSVSHGRALELAQLVVENPGKMPVTIYSPGLSITGHEKKNYTLVPRLFATDGSFGPDQAVTDTVVRLEPYARVTFLLDYWSVIPDVLKGARKDRVFLRGHVGVAGRTKRPQKSSRRLQWRIKQGDYTAIAGSPEFTPFAVIWRELYVRLPERGDNQPQRHSHAAPPVTRGLATHIVEEAMSQFDSRPERDEMQNALDEAAKKYGDRFPMVGVNTLEAYEALDRMDGHLTDWNVGLFRASSKKTGEVQDGGSETSGVAVPPAEAVDKPDQTEVGPPT